MKKCLGLLMVFAIGGTAWAGSYDMGVSVCPTKPMCYQNIQATIDVCAEISATIETQMCRQNYGSYSVDVYENCDGCNKPKAYQSLCCDLGQSYNPGNYNVCVRHYINPCQNPKCMQCKQYSCRTKPQYCGMTNMSFNVCRNDNLFGKWWALW
jgi:hypothetical protein